MNIYLSFFQSKINHPIPAYSFWEYYIKNGIEEGGYEWQEGDVDWAEGLMYSADEEKLSKWKAETWEKTVKDIQLKHSNKPISFFLSYLYPHQVDEQAIKTIQKMGIPCVNFFCDNVREFKKAPKEFAVFDLNWVPEFKAIGKYSMANYNHINLPMPMWVAPENRKKSIIETNDVSFIGSKDIQRLYLFEEVLEKGVDVSIYGSGWKDESFDTKVSNKIESGGIQQKLLNQVEFLKRFGLVGFCRKMKQRNQQFAVSSSLNRCLKGKPTFEEYITITKESAVTLGVNRFPSYRYPINNPNTYSRLRDIEAPMLGACYLTEWTEGIEEMYEIGEEIEVYRNADELRMKVEHLLKDKMKREELRQAGQDRALNYHCIQKSLYKIKMKLA